MGVIYRINQLRDEVKQGLYRTLIPAQIFARFRIDPVSFKNAQGFRAVRFYCPPGEQTLMIEIRRSPNDRDPVYSIQMSDNPDPIRLDWDFIILNDPDSERFDVDVDEHGRDTLFGSASRNIPEEVRAMKAGLAPGQVRRGLGLLREVVECIKRFALMVGIKTIALEALYYHNAIAYERYGFSYFEGYKRMKRIDELFAQGCALYEKLDGSTPFRVREHAFTVRGRSWAIHDGILNEIDDETVDPPWHSPQMYVMVENPRPMITFDAKEW
ncbi:MAG TPA: hypothetical protein ENF73_06940 [Proteobacteria bacterium]|nr:hypothetical protein [Pseudomonadota bacterium]